MNASRAKLIVAIAAVIAAILIPRAASAEPQFLSKQYNRCSACHYSQTGGGLLTPYGRSLSRQELSTTGRDPSRADPSAVGVTGEEAFLWGALGNALGPVQLGIEVRPSRLQFAFGDVSTSRNLVMNADVIGVYRGGGWTLYGEVGREPTSPGSKIDSYEHWAGYESEKGFGIKAGRFLPAYGVHFADHTSFTRANLGFDKYDQVYGVEVSKTSTRSLVQVSFSPGLADSVIHDDGRRAFTTTARVQLDLGTSTVLVGSGLYRDGSVTQAKTAASGLAFGFTPVPRLTVWTEGDARFTEGVDSRSYVVANETAFEAARGVWVTVSPQLRTAVGSAPRVFRWVFSTDLLPRTHWNVNVSYYRDKPAASASFRTLLAQLHVYL